MTPVDVPRVPGVPPVLFASLTDVLRLLTRDSLSFSGFSRSSWGIYSGGTSIISADNVVAFDYKQTWALSDFPLERGAFETYDKVQIPFSGQFRFSRGGSEADRSQFLSSIAAVAGDYNLYNIVTPDAVYVNVNIVRYDYSRAAQQGAGLLSVDIDTMEVRIVSSGSFSNTLSPTNQSAVNGGSVSPLPANPSQVQLVTNATGRVIGPV